MVYCKRPKFCSFHRGRILKLFPSQNSAKVYLLDIGIVCDLFYNAIYEIPADLQDIRGIAFTVELVSIILKETEAFTQLHLGDGCMLEKNKKIPKSALAQSTAKSAIVFPIIFIFTYLSLSISPENAFNSHLLFIFGNLLCWFVIGCIAPFECPSTK